MIVGGLDAATTSGLSVIDGDRLVMAESFRPEGDSHAEIFAGFREWLISNLRRYKVEHLGIEQPLPSNRGFVQKKVHSSDAFGAASRKVWKPVSNMSSFLLLYGLRAHALEAGYSIGVNVREVNIRTWRQAIYGRCDAPKGTKEPSKWWKKCAIERCKILGWPIDQADAAESALIADYMRAALNPRFSGYASVDELFVRK